jgi:hypothetical protein
MFYCSVLYIGTDGTSDKFLAVFKATNCTMQLHRMLYRMRLVHGAACPSAAIEQSSSSHISMSITASAKCASSKRKSDSWTVLLIIEWCEAGTTHINISPSGDYMRL